MDPFLLGLLAMLDLFAFTTDGVVCMTQHSEEEHGTAQYSTHVMHAIQWYIN